jgi:hypothetical protein
MGFNIREIQLMKRTDFNQKTHQENERTVARSASAGPQGLAVMPPAYRIDVIDRGFTPTPGWMLQTQLTINEPGDEYEQEADEVADLVMRMPEPQLQRKCSCGGTSGHDGECEACKQSALSLQRKATTSAEAARAPPIVDEVLQASGHPIDPVTRTFMESRFRRDFSEVRLHADAKAAESARAVNALAYTVGRNVVFGTGQYVPQLSEGKRLIAHELAHVVQQGAVTHSPGEAAGDFQISRVSKPSRLQRQPKGDKDSPKAEACPPVESGEKEEAAKAGLRLVERIPQQEWLIYGFPIGGSEISRAEAGRFIYEIQRSLRQGHLVYVTGQDPLEVLGFSDCFTGPQVDNHVLRQLRATKFCAGVQDYYASTPKSYSDLIRFCGAAPADQYVGSNATRADRAQNRSILIRRVAAAKVLFQEGSESFPYNPKFGPSKDHCAAYSTGLARDILGRVYTKNAYCSCLVTPDEPHNNCVRDCLQGKMWNLLANASRNRKPNDPPMDINVACLAIWQHHRECYHDCGCASEFIAYEAFNAVCNMALPCAVDSAAINLVNRCMPATKNDKYLPVD